MLIDLKVWLDHFEYHGRQRWPLPQGRPIALSAGERRIIASSIATFQLGEQSEGRSLLRSAKAYEAAHTAVPVARIMELIIAEERHHARQLGSFMDQHGLPRKCSDWTDGVFRFVRRLAGFELHITVLITAELIGKVYYRALEAATANRQLQVLCRLLIADELAHVGFESDLLRTMRARKPTLIRAMVVAAHRAFLSGTALVVWATHRRVLCSAGYRLPLFLRACDAQYVFYLGVAVGYGRSASAPLA